MLEKIKQAILNFLGFNDEEDKTYKQIQSSFVFDSFNDYQEKYAKIIEMIQDFDRDYFTARTLSKSLLSELYNYSEGALNVDALVDRYKFNSIKKRYPNLILNTIAISVDEYIISYKRADVEDLLNAVKASEEVLFNIPMEAKELAKSLSATTREIRLAFLEQYYEPLYAIAKVINTSNMRNAIEDPASVLTMIRQLDELLLDIERQETDVDLRIEKDFVAQRHKVLEMQKQAGLAYNKGSAQDKAEHQIQQPLKYYYSANDLEINFEAKQND